MSWVWFGLGLFSGWCTIVLHVWSVSRLVPQSRARILLWTQTGLFLRWLLVAATLAIALNSSLTAGLTTFAGLWLMRRWLVYRIHKQRAFTNWFNLSNASRSGRPLSYTEE